ncbi:hypothetical protein [Streptomyces sp. NPDC051567]|uniref:hypothetical protein n=1 Tax=Streptomyces sp. NPDC051567 TaxID=3365660 RepID=UPI0037B4C934
MTSSYGTALSWTSAGKQFGDLLGDILGITDVMECIDDPGVAKCALAFLMATPAGKVIKGFNYAGKAKDYFGKLFGKSEKFVLCATGYRSSALRSVVVRSASSCPVGFKEISPGLFQSPKGLKYGPGSDQGHRIRHVMEHTKENPEKRKHSVFNITDQAEVLALVDEAWGRRHLAMQYDSANSPESFIIPMGREVGTTGEKLLKVVADPKTGKLLTAFPRKVVAECL